MRFSPISSTVPNTSASRPRMHNYAIRAGGAGAVAVQVVRCPWVIDCADSYDGDHPCGYSRIFGGCFCVSGGVSVGAVLGVTLGVLGVFILPFRQQKYHEHDEQRECE